MPFKESEIEKYYYSVSEVARMFDVNPSLIRYWENVFPSLNPHKNNKGNRLFTKEDINHLRLIYHLVKEKGLTLKGAQKKLRENVTELQGNYEVVKRLQEIRRQLKEIREELEE